MRRGVELQRNLSRVWLVRNREETNRNVEASRETRRTETAGCPHQTARPSGQTHRDATESFR